MTTQIGSRDRLGNLLILGGHKADLLRTKEGRFIVGTHILDTEELAVDTYNHLNGTSLPLNYISVQFQPWFNRTKGIEGGRIVCRVPSRSTEGVDYEVKYSLDGNLVCECPGSSYRGDCWHIEAVRDILKEE